jgi:hypothetical protein
MPTKTYMQIDVRHDQFVAHSAPRPERCVRHAERVQCCHAKKTPQWAADAIRG